MTGRVKQVTRLHHFELNRVVDESGISGTGVIAEGVQFSDGTCALRWLTEHRSTAVYDDMTTLMHIHGHGGKTELVWVSDVYKRAQRDALQDSWENAPFASVGGLENRHQLVAPKYINGGEAEEYLRGYRDMAAEMYGADWQTCRFGWGNPVLIEALPVWVGQSRAD